MLCRSIEKDGHSQFTFDHPILCEAHVMSLTPAALAEIVGCQDCVSAVNRLDLSADEFIDPTGATDSVSVHSLHCAFS